MKTLKSKCLVSWINYNSSQELIKRVVVLSSYCFYSRLVSCSIIVAIAAAAAAAAAVVNSDMGQRNGGKVVDMVEMPIKV